MKKAYITPAITAYVLNITNSILALSGGEDVQYGGDTNSNGVLESDTKGSGDYDLWDE